MNSYRRAVEWVTLLSVRLGVIGFLLGANPGPLRTGARAALPMRGEGDGSRFAVGAVLDPKVPVLPSVQAKSSSGLNLVPPSPRSLAKTLRIETDFIQTSLGIGEDVSFTVSLTNTFGGWYSLRLLNPPPGMVLSQRREGEGVEAHFRWRVSGSKGKYFLRFQARDPQGCVALERTLVLQVIGGALSERYSLLSGDVTGDGIPDAIGGAVQVPGGPGVGAIYVVPGGTTSNPPPTSFLSCPGAVEIGIVGDFSGPTLQQAIHLDDVTGDGILDIVAGASRSSASGIPNAGALYVWAGGPGILDSPQPTALLSRPGPSTGDFLGYIVDGLGILFADVTNDGIDDLIVGASRADVGGVVDAGAIFVWEGGSSLSGSPLPMATLAVPGAQPSDELGRTTDPFYTEIGQALLLGDVTADGIPDIVAAASGADVSGVIDAGAIYMWKGGSSLLGNLPPTATMHAPSPIANARLADAIRGCGLFLVDVSGDAVLDVVALASREQASGRSAGAVHVFNGGPSLSGLVLSTATLWRPDTDQGGNLGNEGGVSFGDVNGDGVLDIVARDSFAELGFGTNSPIGAIYAWPGGSLAGSLSAWATLVPSGLERYTHLGWGGVLLCDLDGDGADEILAATPENGISDPGAIYFVPGAASGDYLGLSSHPASISFAEVTGDGVLDIVAIGKSADVGGLIDAGAVYVFRGGSAMNGDVHPLADLRAPDAVSGDNLGLSGWGTVAVPLVADVTADGKQDIVVAAKNKDLGGVPNVGAIYVWKGGGALRGTPAPDGIMTLPAAWSDTFLGAGGPGVQLVDLSGDGHLDVMAGSSRGDLVMFLGGALEGSVAPQWRTTQSFLGQ